MRVLFRLRATPDADLSACLALYSHRSLTAGNYTVVNMERSESNKRRAKHIVWDEGNLQYNEANKSAKMKIDEPETPWASPPKELFEDGDAGADGKPEVAMDEVAERLKVIESEADGSAPSSSGGNATGGTGDGEWESSDDEGEGKQKREGELGVPKQQKKKLSFPDPTSGDEAVDGNSNGNGGGGDGDGGGGALDDVDKVLRARLFEAQRKAHQCTMQSPMSRGRALLDEEEDDEEGEGEK